MEAGDCMTVMCREDKDEIEWWCAHLNDKERYVSHSLLGLYSRIKPRQRSCINNKTMPFFRGSSQPRDWTQVSYIAGIFFSIWGTKEAPVVQLMVPLLAQNRTVTVYLLSATWGTCAHHSALASCQGLLHQAEHPLLTVTAPSYVYFQSNFFMAFKLLCH